VSFRGPDGSCVRDSFGTWSYVVPVSNGPALDQFVPPFSVRKRVE
jgi:hypothetical protein